MKGDQLPPSDNIARHCEKRFFFEGTDIGPGNFELRGHTYLSVDWLEHLGPGKMEEQLPRLIKLYAEKALRTIGKKDKFGVLNVGTTIDLVKQKSIPAGKILRILHEPLTVLGKENSAHSGIFDTANDNHINVLLAQHCKPIPAHP